VSIAPVRSIVLGLLGSASTGVRRRRRRGLIAIMHGMAYDEDLANRIRELLADEPGVTEKAMFGGLAFLLGGHMAIAASGQDGALVRVDPEETDALMAEPHAGPMEMRGRAMRGWLRVAPEGVASVRELEPWVRRGVDYARSLPPKVTLSAA
jgi:TfoX N-terminal domain